MERIKIEKSDAKYLWNVLNLKENYRSDNTDEQWGTPEENRYYFYYDYENVVIQAAFEILDANAEMDSNEFCGWDNPNELYVMTEMAVMKLDD